MATPAPRFETVVSLCGGEVASTNRLVFYYLRIFVALYYQNAELFILTYGAIVSQVSITSCFTVIQNRSQLSLLLLPLLVCS